MSKHIIQRLHASVLTSDGDLVDYENSVCIEFDTDKEAVYPFHSFIWTDRRQLKRLGHETLSDATAASSAMLDMLRRNLLLRRNPVMVT